VWLGAGQDLSGPDGGFRLVTGGDSADANGDAVANFGVRTVALGLPKSRERKTTQGRQRVRRLLAILERIIAELFDPRLNLFRVGGNGVPSKEVEGFGAFIGRREGSDGDRSNDQSQGQYPLPHGFSFAGFALDW